MSARGFFSAQEGHIVPLIFPQDETGGKTSPAFGMRNHAHASIYVLLGVTSAAPGLITLRAATDATGAVSQAIGFTLFAGENSNIDTLGPKIVVPAAGYQPPATDFIYYVIEVQADQLPQGYPYLVLTLADGANSAIAAAVAMLSGARYAGDQNASVLV